MEMRKLVVLVSAVVLGAACTMAQYGSGSYDNQGAAPRPDNGKVSVLGCLAEAGGNFTLTDRWGTAYQLIGNTEKLSAHVGQTIRATGTSSLAEQNPGSMNPGAMSEDMETPPTLSVTSFRHVSSHCGVTKGSSGSGSY